MLFMLIVAFIATIGFYRRAKEVGVHPGKAGSVPFVAAGALIALTHVSTIAVERSFSAMNMTAGATQWCGYAMDFVLILGYLFFIKRNWDMLNSCTSATGE